MTPVFLPKDTLYGYDSVCELGLLLTVIQLPLNAYIHLLFNAAVYIVNSTRGHLQFERNRHAVNMRRRWLFSTCLAFRLKPVKALQSLETPQKACEYP
jgi:hypothetical protein